MNDADHDSEPSDSDYSSGSEHDMPSDEPVSVPERRVRSDMPRLALGGAAASDAAKQRRPAIPVLGLKTTSLRSDKGSEIAQQSSLQAAEAAPQADHPIAREDSDTAETESLQPTITSGRHSGAQSFGRANSQRRSSRQAAAPQFRIQLASEAFDIWQDTLHQPQYQHSEQIDAVRQLCSERLGLRSDALKLFELQEVSSLAECSDQCAQLALVVQGSGFSLTAYEDMLNRSKQHSVEAQQKTVALRELQRLVEDQNLEVGKGKRRIGELEKEMREKEEHCNRLQREVAFQRDQLHRSDNRNLEGQKSLQMLKEQFDNLSTSRRSSLAAALASPRGSGNLVPALSSARMGQELRSSPSLNIQEGTTQRLLDVLEILSNDKVLTKMENVCAALCSKADIKSE